ncbi:nuclear transport factor 2 family protein [Nocardia sp. CA-128927]|uniref:nuclear transport factor 2 family protein n=1 Tax=Nocardia sp. CA-128927 TaxID=3239975 RepID=UPI003D963B42
MSTSENKELVRRFFELFTGKHPAQALDLLSDEVTWWTNGEPGRNIWAGTQTKAEMIESFSGFSAIFTTGLVMTPVGFVADGDKVAMEAESSAQVVNGKSYRNQYHFLIEVHNGKITSVREYMDTQHVTDTFADISAGSPTIGDRVGS